MPNGGIPMHMVLYPKTGKSVIVCSRGEVKMFARDTWERDRSQAEPFAVLDKAEAAALAGFIRYWAGERSPTYSGPDVNSVFDW